MVGENGDFPGVQSILLPVRLEIPGYDHDLTGAVGAADVVGIADVHAEVASVVHVVSRSDNTTPEGISFVRLAATGGHYCSGIEAQVGIDELAELAVSHVAEVVEVDHLWICPAGSWFLMVKQDLVLLQALAVVEEERLCQASLHVAQRPQPFAWGVILAVLDLHLQLHVAAERIRQVVGTAVAAPC